MEISKYLVKYNNNDREVIDKRNIKMFKDKIFEDPMCQTLKTLSSNIEMTE
jgi:hypothetical protein